jgi:hypothetical protein
VGRYLSTHRKAGGAEGSGTSLAQSNKRVVARRTEAGRCDGVMRDGEGIRSERVKARGHEKAAILGVI